MAVQIPIWVGSSSFSPGMTPMGYYDSDTVFQGEVDKVAKWCATRLGYPIQAVELNPIHFYSAFEEAISEFGAYVNSYNIKDNLIYMQGADLSGSIDYNDKKISKNFGNIISIAKEYGSEVGSGGTVSYKTGSILLQEGQQRVDLKTNFIDIYESGSTISIQKIINAPVPASVRYLLPFAAQDFSAGVFGFGKQSTATSMMMMPMHGDILRMQAVEFNDMLRRSQYSFTLRNNLLTIYPIPQEPRRILFEYFVNEERNNPIKNTNDVVSDYSNAPYGNKQYKYINAVGKQWIKKYTLAVAMETLGNVRSKYSSIPIPNSDITLNGDALISSAENMKQSLIDELKEMLEALTTKSQMEAEQMKSELLSNTLKYMPTKIYIG